MNSYISANSTATATGRLYNSNPPLGAIAQVNIVYATDSISTNAVILSAVGFSVNRFFSPVGSWRNTSAPHNTTNCKSIIA